MNFLALSVFALLLVAAMAMPATEHDTYYSAEVAVGDIAQEG